MPEITEADKTSEQYQQGVSCPHCYNKITTARKVRFMEPEAHIGADAAKKLV
ncbi:MAG TPA: hypothetical protein VIE65_09290 [Methylobacter sp.]|jgi:UPF0176 protein